mmetsp:Transcript_3481/g.10784  ORF Transcript_3481/g.10784 Transcript_3481/m.10784 type:complete len:213 (-) Transcript_3481:184-822(-)
MDLEGPCRCSRGAAQHKFKSPGHDRQRICSITQPVLRTWKELVHQLVHQSLDHGGNAVIICRVTPQHVVFPAAVANGGVNQIVGTSSRIPLFLDGRSDDPWFAILRRLAHQGRDAISRALGCGIEEHHCNVCVFKVFCACDGAPHPMVCSPVNDNFDSTATGHHGTHGVVDVIVGAAHQGRTAICSRLYQLPFHFGRLPEHHDVVPRCVGHL